MWPNPQFPTDLVTFTEEILHEKLHFMHSKKKASNHFIFWISITTTDIALTNITKLKHVTI